VNVKTTATSKGSVTTWEPAKNPVAAAPGSDLLYQRHRRSSAVGISQVKPSAAAGGSDLSPPAYADGSDLWRFTLIHMIHEYLCAQRIESRGKGLSRRSG
jgi:hypothetical protein